MAATPLRYSVYAAKGSETQRGTYAMSCTPFEQHAVVPFQRQLLNKNERIVSFIVKAASKKRQRRDITICTASFPAS
jgi:hypothetical protein